MAILSFDEVDGFPQSESGHTYRNPELVQRLRNLQVGKGIAVRLLADSQGNAPTKDVQAIRNDIGAYKKEKRGAEIKSRMERGFSTDGQGRRIYTMYIVYTSQESPVPPGTDVPQPPPAPSPYPQPPSQYPQPQ